MRHRWLVLCVVAACAALPGTANAAVQRVDCGTFRVLELSSAVFGGSTGTPLGIAVRLANRTDRLTVTVRSGERVLRRWRIPRARAGHTYRLRLPASVVPRGRTVRITAVTTRGSRRAHGQILAARRL